MLIISVIAVSVGRKIFRGRGNEKIDRKIALLFLFRGGEQRKKG